MTARRGPKKSRHAERSENALDYFKRTTGPLTLGRLLRSIRLGEELSLRAFSSRLGVSLANLSDIEHGRRGVSAERAEKWARELGYPAWQFVQLALQAELDAAGIKMKVSVKAA
jgi:transcriptional regulator with XRE-family HTH domain